MGGQPPSTDAMYMQLQCQPLKSHRLQAKLTTFFKYHYGTPSSNLHPNPPSPPPPSSNSIDTTVAQCHLPSSSMQDCKTLFPSDHCWMVLSSARSGDCPFAGDILILDIAPDCTEYVADTNILLVLILLLIIHVIKEPSAVTFLIFFFCCYFHSGMESSSSDEDAIVPGM